MGSYRDGYNPLQELVNKKASLFSISNFELNIGEEGHDRFSATQYFFLGWKFP